MVVGHLRGLAIVTLEYDYATPLLDTWDPTALHLAGLWSPPRSIRESNSPSISRSPGESAGTDFVLISVLMGNIFQVFGSLIRTKTVVL